MDWFNATNEKSVQGRFKYMDKLDVPKSLEADEEVFKKIVVCEMRIIGSSDVSVVQIKPHNQKELTTRFAEAWSRFQGEMPEVDGTPIEDLPGIADSKAEILRLQGVHTIELLADAAEHVLDNLGFGSRKLQEKAIEFLTTEKPSNVEPIRKRGRPRKNP